MVLDPYRWLDRAYRLTVWADWLALTVGMIAAIYVAGGSPASLTASGLAGLSVLLATSVPMRRLTQRFVTEGFALASALLSLAAVTLTGLRDSPFLILSFLPPIQATLLGGIRVGAATGALSGAVLIAVALSQDDAIVPTIGIAATYLILVATINQLVRIASDLEAKNLEIEARSQGAEARLHQLEKAHELLSRLADMAGDGVSLPDISREALSAIANHPQVEAASAVLHAPNGQVTVARQGQPSPGAIEHRVPLVVGANEVGSVRLHVRPEVSETTEFELDTVLRPLALAFANALLLERIAQNAVERERVRVARDLHDEIGPNLASLGLSLDVTLMQHEPEPALAAQMEVLRERVGTLINDVRATVADLRAPSSGSLIDSLHDAVLDLEAPPELTVAVEERRPPRPALMPDLVAVLIEAIRNAHRHSGGTEIMVTGWTDFDRGALTVRDNGLGFDVLTRPPGHYGLIGMEERASKTGMKLTVESGSQGTLVTVEWGKK